MPAVRIDDAVAADAGEPTLVRCVRLRAFRRVLWLRALWASTAEPTMQGMAISHQEIDRALGDPDRLADQERRFYRTDPAAQPLEAAIQTTEDALRTEPRWARLREEFGLSAHEMDLLALAAAAEIVPALARVYGYLHDDAALLHATPALAAALFEWPSAARITPAGALARWRFAHPLDGSAHAGSPTAPWVADPEIVTWLVHGGDPAASAAATVASNDPAPKLPCLYPEQLAALRGFVDAVRGTDGRGDARAVPIELALVGAVGAGKRTLARQLADALGMSLLVEDAGALARLDAAAAAAHAIQTVRRARLADAILCWHDAGASDRRLWERVDPAPIAVFTSDALPFGRGYAAMRRTVTLPPLACDVRLTLWQRLSDVPAPDRVHEWSLTPAEIAAAAAVVAAGSDAVAEACRPVLVQGTGDLLAPLWCSYEPHDLVVTQHVHDQLRELETQARLRAEVYDEWGFGRLCPQDRGVTALFAGPSGTGKTMAAQVLARSLGMDLYRVDLAGVMNKYIGETEKNLRRLFDGCERANVVLFFDEADALFSRRTQVKDAHDRFANIEIDYLLQRMERFDGVAILATNRKEDIDPAFLRRLRFLVDFVAPGRTERLALWQLALGPQSPSGETLIDAIDWPLLAGTLAMTGAEIKLAALGAAFLARADGQRIGMRHVLTAARRELAKRGVTVRNGDLGE